MHKACFNGHLECAKLLADAGAKVVYEDGYSSPLHAAAFGGHVNCLEFLLKQGANVMALDGENATPLHKAAFSGHVDACKILLDNGAVRSEFSWNVSRQIRWDILACGLSASQNVPPDLSLSLSTLS